ncbi:MAG: hypothetical protein AMXMBFR64_47740 [Myxococcales bacterium]
MTAILLAALVLCSYTVGTLAGFGSNVLIVTLASHLMPVQELLPILLPLNLALNGWLVMRHGRHVDRRLLLRLALLMAPGVAVGVVVFFVGSGALLKTLLGAFVLCVGVLELLHHARGARSPALPRLLAWPLLAVAGVFQGLFASGGPLAVWVVARELPDKASFRATLAALWLLLNGAVLSSYAAGGLLDATSLRATAPLLLPFAAALIAGERLHDRIDQQRFRLLVFALLALGGAALLASR